MRFNFNNLNPLFKPYLTRRTLRSPLALQPLNSHYNYDTPLYIPKRWHLGHSDHHHDTGEQGEKIFRLGLAADIGLAAGKAFTGYVSGSTAIIADAAHSVSDVVLSGVALLSFKAGKAPKDKEHPYGHGKFETLGALGISSMLLITAGGIGWHAIDILLGLLSGASEVGSHSLMHDHGHSPDHHGGGHHHGIDMSHPGLALTMTVVSISVKEGLYWITKRAGEKQGSGLMKANAWHHRADAISSIVALIGVGGSILGVRFLDPLAGLVVSGMILKAGLETGYQSIMELVDAAIPGEHLDPIRKTILHVEGVKGCHRLRGRRAGSCLFLDVHIEVDPFLSVSAAHGIGENVRQAIHRFHPEIAEAFIHIDPSISDFSPSMMYKHEKLEGISSQNNNNSFEDKEIEGIVSDVFLTKLLKKVKVEHVTRHLLQGKTLLEIEVSMPPDILIREAMEAAEAAEEEILKAASDIIQVSLQLRLGKPIPKHSIEQRET